jgi:multidrug resistance efflux pump
VRPLQAALSVTMVGLVGQLARWQWRLQAECAAATGDQVKLQAAVDSLQRELGDAHQQAAEAEASLVSWLQAEREAAAIGLSQTEVSCGGKGAVSALGM